MRLGTNFKTLGLSELPRRDLIRQLLSILAKKQKKQKRGLVLSCRRNGIRKPEEAGRRGGLERAYLRRPSLLRLSSRQRDGISGI